MWRDGFSLELIAWALNAIALAFGGALGLRAFFDPRWCQRIVRLQPDPEKPGGFAEFRASYGGFFLGAHAIAFYLSALWLYSGVFESGVYATAASATLAAAWGATAAGRGLSMLRDRTRTGYNIFSMCLEGALALAIAAPHLVWYFSRPS